MREPTPANDWPESWTQSYRFDLNEVFGRPTDRAYARAYAERFRRTIAAVERVVPPGSRILDIAAAQGNFTLALAERGYAATWNDLRAELASYVELKYDRGSVEFAPGNCFELANGEPYDALLVTEVIEHVAHPDLFLANLATLVKPGGHIVMTTPNGAYFRNRLPRFSECANPEQFESVQFKPDADGHIFLLYPDEIGRLARDAGLVPLELHLFINPLTRGALRLDRLLRLVPSALVDAIESATSARGGLPLRRLNMQALSVLQRPNPSPAVTDVEPEGTSTHTMARAAK